MGVTLSLVLENLDTTITTIDDVQGWLEVPNLAIIPHLDLPDHDPLIESPGLVVHHGTQPLAAESYRVLRTSIFFSAPDQGPRILLLTSSVPGEGKTLTVANLGIAMAKTEKEVLLIDSDFRRPALNRLFNIPMEPGLTNYLVGETDDLPVVPTMTPHLFVVPAGTTSPNPSELIGSGRMQEFLSRARENFSFIIMDSPPLISVTDATVLASHSDGVVMVIRYETVPRKVAVEARDKLLDVKSNLLGVVLNDVPLERESYYHKYYSRYYYDHDKIDNNKTVNNYISSLSNSKGILEKLKTYFHRYI